VATTGLVAVASVARALAALGPPDLPSPPYLPKGAKGGINTAAAVEIRHLRHCHVHRVRSGIAVTNQRLRDLTVHPPFIASALNLCTSMTCGGTFGQGIHRWDCCVICSDQRAGLGSAGKRYPMPRRELPPDPAPAASSCSPPTAATTTPTTGVSAAAADLRLSAIRLSAIRGSLRDRRGHLSGVSRSRLLLRMQELVGGGF
jgi:hypothetical protein